MEKNEYKQAKEDLLIVKQLQDDPEVEMNLAFAYYSLENPDSALIAINKSIELRCHLCALHIYMGDLFH
jgi:Flp pilus assembly protein TadD